MNCHEYIAEYNGEEDLENTREEAQVDAFGVGRVRLLPRAASVRRASSWLHASGSVRAPTTSCAEQGHFLELWQWGKKLVASRVVSRIRLRSLTQAFNSWYRKCRFTKRLSREELERQLKTAFMQAASKLNLEAVSIVHNIQVDSGVHGDS